MKRHGFDVISFASGLIFVLIAGALALGSNFDLNLNSWLLPASILVLGIGLLASTMRGIRKPATVEEVDVVTADQDDVFLG